MLYYPDQNNPEKYISKYVDYGMEDPTEYYYTVGYGDLDNSEDQEAIKKLFPTDITNIPYNIYDYYGARSKRYFSGEQAEDRFGQDDIPDDYEGNNFEGSYNWGKKARTKKHQNGGFISFSKPGSKLTPKYENPAGEIQPITETLREIPLGIRKTTVVRGGPENGGYTQEIINFNDGTPNDTVVFYPNGLGGRNYIRSGTPQFKELHPKYKKDLSKYKK